MDIENINRALDRRFAAPLPEFYKRRLIFWHDEEREFADKLDGLELNNAKLVKLTGSNTFAVKKLLTEDDTSSNYLVYDPLSFQKDDDNWLINIQLYSEEFRADLNSIWMDEMGLSHTPDIRQLLKAYHKFFNAKARREAVAKLTQNSSSTLQIQLAVLATLAGCHSAHPHSILRAVLGGGYDPEQNSIYRNFVNYGAHNIFWAMAAHITGYNDGDDAHLGRLAIHVLLTAATRTMHQDNLEGLEHFISLTHQANCYDIVSDWLHSSDNRLLSKTALYVEQETRLYNRFEKLEVADLVDTECFPCLDEVILIKLLTEIGDNIINIDLIRSTVEKRRTMTWYSDSSCYYDGLLQVANMQQFFLEHAAGFHTVEPQNVWKEYTTDYYKMDSYYRQFHLCFQRCLNNSNEQLDDLFKQVTEKAEGLYSTWYLGQLGANWSHACEDELAKSGRIPEIPQQADFYRDKVSLSDTRVFVIISDALRYEVAASLAEQLRQETQSRVDLSSMQAIFPTITKFGMAALLPHQQLDVIQDGNIKLSVIADKISTEAGYRDTILKQANPNSVALKYDDIIYKKRTERQALVKGMEVVYIYHDKIDKASHTSDAAVFPACAEAISEIKNLVKIIVNEFGGTRIYITSDHGFLYTYSPLQEDDKIDTGDFINHVIEYGRRFAIMHKEANPDYLMPVLFLDGRSEYKAYAPREDTRLKKNGGGLNFVHGGASLQEMVVPLIDYRYLRSDTKAYKRNRARIDTKPAAVKLISASRKISNMIFSLNFYQTEAVGGNREAATYQLYFTDANGQKISDVKKIIADKTNDNIQERTFRLNFSLKSQSYNNRACYYLVIADETGLQAPQKEEFQIDIPFAVDDFNFF